MVDMFIGSKVTPIERGLTGSSAVSLFFTGNPRQADKDDDFWAIPGNGKVGWHYKWYWDQR